MAQERLILSGNGVVCIQWIELVGFEQIKCRNEREKELICGELAVQWFMNIADRWLHIVRFLLHSAHIYITHVNGALQCS